MVAKKLTESHRALRGLAIAMLLGLICIFGYAAHESTNRSFFAVASVGVLLAGAAAFAGGALGFLFGIPRTLQQDGASNGDQLSVLNGETGTTARRIDYRVNTNLEQISDWLTKILVGVSLTQIAEIRAGVASIAAFAAEGLGGSPQDNVFALALLSYSAVLGFLFGYLWTRLFLAGAFRVADQAAIGTLVAEVQKTNQKVETTERKLEEFKNQSALDAAALNLAYRQLNPSPDVQQVSQEELDAAVAAASRPTKVQIFNQAWQVRSSNWRDPANKPKMERSIPVFRALIHNDVENTYHMNHGQLGFALKDKRQPDWEEAEKEITTAIEIRGPWNEKGWIFYEFTRALCRIMNDPTFSQGQPSDETRRQQIVEDLRIAVHAEEVEKAIRAEPVIQEWMSKNHVTWKELRNAVGHEANHTHAKHG